MPAGPPTAPIFGIMDLMADADELSEPPPATDTSPDDPRAKWRVLPDRIPPEQWVTEHADPAVPGSVQAAEDERQTRAAWNDIRWGIA